MAIPDSDADYYRMREQQERDRAHRATADEARAIHLALADKYLSLALKADGIQKSSIEGHIPLGPRFI